MEVCLKLLCLGFIGSSIVYTTKEKNLHERKSGTSARDIFVVAVFLLFFLIQLAHHQMWRDEMNVWGLILASPTLASLVANARFEGHTLFWYLLLWIPAHISSSQLVMKVVEGVVGCAIYCTLGFFSPFSRFEKVLIFLTYFVIFEYTVMVRMYSSCLLLMLIFYIGARSTRASTSAMWRCWAF